MRITASQAVKTTAKLQTVGKQLSLIGSNLLKGKYASVDELKRVRASVVNASNIARRANDQILDSISSVDELKDVISCGDADVMDKALEGSLEVATRAAMLCKAIDGEVEKLEPEEDDGVEVSDEILDDEGADVEASEDDPEVADDEVTDEVLDNEASEDDSVEDEPEVDDIEDDKALDNEAGEDDEIEEVEAPIVAKKKAAVATKKASVIKKQASVRGSISWTMPSLPEAKRR